MNCLDVRHLYKKYGDITAAEDLSFGVGDGEIFGLIGPNGAGKSTTIMMILGLLRTDRGSILLKGQQYDPRNPDQRSFFGFVPQELAIYSELSAIQNLRFFGKTNGLSGERLRDRVDYVLDVTGLARHAHQIPRTFSGGMSRRLNFGIALLQQPQFVILDEPTVGIDPQSRARLLSAVRDLAQSGVGILYASHYMEEIEEICDRIAILDHGRILKLGTLTQLLDETEHDLTLIVADLPDDLATLLRNVAEIHKDPNGAATICVHVGLKSQGAAGHDNLRTTLEMLRQRGVALCSIDSGQTNLESLFLRLTGRTLRD